MADTPPPCSELGDRNSCCWLVALGCVGFYSSDPPAYFADFLYGYYPAGLAVLDSPGKLRPLTDAGALGFASLPIVAYLFAPLALLPPHLAVGLFTIFGVAAIAASWILLVRLVELDTTNRWVLALLFVANGPLIASVRHGNLTHYVFFALVAGLCLMRAKRSVATGILIGVAAIVKPPLLLFGAFFVFRRDVWGSAAFASVTCMAVIASLVVFGWDDNLNWLKVCILQYSTQWTAAFNDQSISSFLFRFRAGPELIRDWNTYPALFGERLAVQILTAFFYLSAAVCCLVSTVRARQSGIESSEARMNLQYLLIPTLAIVSSPLAWNHYYAWLLLPTAFFLGSHILFSKAPVVYCAGWVAIGLTMPLGLSLVFSHPGITNLYWHFGVSHFLLAGIIWLGLLAWRLITTDVRVIPGAELANPLGQRRLFSPA